MNPAQVTVGQDATNTNTTPRNRATGIVYVTRAFLLSALKWDFYASGTYDFQFVDGTSATPNVLYTLASGVSISGTASASGQENTITVAPEVLVLPGKHYLSAYTSTAVGWVRRGTNTVEIDGGAFIFDLFYVDGSAAGSLPSKLVGYYVDIVGLVNYQPNKV
jgi:hypothetical protein